MMKNVLFEDEFLKSMISPRIFAPHFFFRRHGHIIFTKISDLFLYGPQITHILCVWSGIKFGISIYADTSKMFVDLTLPQKPKEVENYPYIA